MRLYLAGESALELIRYLRSTNGEDGLGGEPVRRRTLNDAINKNTQVNALDETATRWLSHVSLPIQAFVGGHEKGTSTSRLITRVFGSSVSAGCFLDLGHDICISTPQLTFLQLATTHTLIELLKIGMELCGHYSSWRLPPAAMGDPIFLENAENRGCTFNLPIAVRARNLERFVRRMSGHHGAVAARQAARWLLDESASPMETATYLLLCLPRKLGGYALPQPVLNPKVTVSNPDGKHERYPDLFWRLEEQSVDVEYQSDAEHSGNWARYRDSQREVQLVVGNIRVLPLTRPQLMHVDEFDAFAQGLRRMMRIRTRPKASLWELHRAELRGALLPLG